MNLPRPPAGYLRPSQARDILVKRMFGNLPPTKGVQRLREQGIRAGAGEWRERAAQDIRKAVLDGQLTLRVVSAAGETEEPLTIEQARSLIPSRGGFPDVPYRLSIALVRLGVFELELFSQLNLGAGLLAFLADDFEKWCEKPEVRRRWPSHRTARKGSPKPSPKGGKPAKYREPLRNAIIARVTGGEWNASMPLTALKELLNQRSRLTPLPSADTLARRVDELFVETGDKRYLRRLRRARTLPS